jgi:hypothetical protein
MVCVMSSPAIDDVFHQSAAPSKAPASPLLPVLPRRLALARARMQQRGWIMQGRRHPIGPIRACRLGNRSLTTPVARNVKMYQVCRRF